MTFGRGLRAGLMGFRALVVAALVAYAGLPEDAAQAGPLIQNGSFEQTSNISSPGGYICRFPRHFICRFPSHFRGGAHNIFGGSSRAYRVASGGRYTSSARLAS